MMKIKFLPPPQPTPLDLITKRSRDRGEHPAKSVISADYAALIRRNQLLDQIERDRQLGICSNAWVELMK